MAKVTGLGGVFYVVKDPEATRAWYRDVLGVEGEYGPQFLWSNDRKQGPYSLISMFKDDSYIRPGKGEFMINLRVDDVDGFVVQLREKGIEVLETSDEGYAKFAWLLDCDGIKVELWEQRAPAP